MWSLGCILYELLSAALETTEEARKECKDKFRHVLFKGNHCFPLSPKAKDGAGMKFDEQDQLHAIVE